MAQDSSEILKLKRISMSGTCNTGSGQHIATAGIKRRSHRRKETTTHLLQDPGKYVWKPEEGKRL